jgi:hypothetical protein
VVNANTSFFIVTVPSFGAEPQSAAGDFESLVVVIVRFAQKAVARGAHRAVKRRIPPGSKSRKSFKISRKEQDFTFFAAGAIKKPEIPEN